MRVLSINNTSTSFKFKKYKLNKYTITNDTNEINENSILDDHKYKGKIIDIYV